MQPQSMSTAILSYLRISHKRSRKMKLVFDAQFVCLQHPIKMFSEKYVYIFLRNSEKEAL